MAQLPLEQGIPRFKANEERINTMTNGGEDETWRTSDGAEVPSIRKLFKEINTEGEGWLAQAKDAAAQAALNNEGVAWLDDVAALLADTTLAYGPGAAHVQAGDIVRTRAEGFAYEVAASGATDHHIATAGGVKLYVLPGADGVYLAAFAPSGDGVADDTSALLSAASLATSAKRRLVVPAGVFLVDATIEVTHGLTCAGEAGTKFQGYDDGTLRTWVLKIAGPGIYSDFTVDGACSADPVVWNSSNYNDFTGWGRALGVYADDVILMNVLVENSFRAAVDSDAITYRNYFVNVRTNRSRGEFGDGFYLRRSSYVSLQNCRAYDFTRIGFVNEGNNASVSAHVTYTNCHAEYGHDQSVDYGGGEFNCGFWAENSSAVTYIGCTSRNTTDRGFTYAATSNLPLFGYDRGQVEYINCDAYDTNTGFSMSSLDSGVRVSASVTDCSTYNCRAGVNGARADLHIKNLSWFFDGGNAQARAVLPGNAARIWVDGLYTEWTNIPTDGSNADPLNVNSDTATVSRFSASQPLFVSIKNAITHDGSPITIKFREASNDLRVEVEGSSVIIPVMRAAQGFSFSDCNIIAKSSGTFSSINDISKRSSVNGCTIDVTDNPLLFGIAAGGDVTLRDCTITREAGGMYVYFLHGHLASDPYTVSTVDSCTLIGNIEADDKIIRVNSAANEARSGDIYVTNSRFINTGGATSNKAITLERSAPNSTVMATGVWKSATITDLATRTATGSTVNDIP